MSTSKGVALVWFRSDLRLADNAALRAAVATGTPVIPLFIWAPDEEASWQPGAASRWWLHQCLTALQESLEALGSRLIIRKDPTRQALLTLIEQYDIAHVFWNRSYLPSTIERDRTLKAELKERGLNVESFSGALLHEPWSIRNQSGKPFQVFTPFWKACLARISPLMPLEAPQQLLAPELWPPSVPLAELALEPKINWAEQMRDTWPPGEGGAQKLMERFAGEMLAGYNDSRNHPGHSGTSRLSPYLALGVVSPRQVWHAAGGDGHGPYLRQIIWREFAHHLLFHFPATSDEPLRAEFARFPWRYDQAAFDAWSSGRTGYPLVDAGMRELWTTGWMHNRVRMVAASLLVKHLLISWQTGAAWFWDTLVDADLANNTLGWQWVAGCGADAAPYFRIFNPVVQGEKFDPAGAYVRRWVPELARLSDNWIHKPWEAPQPMLEAAGVRLGVNYPRPIVEHAAARQRALAALATIRQLDKS